MNPHRLKQTLERELAKVQSDTFTKPPSDWPGFQKILGRHQGLTEALNMVTKTDQDPDQDKDA